MLLNFLLYVAMTTAPSTAPADSLYDPAKKEIAMQLVSAAENSSLDWKAQYGYIEYNVEHNDAENRGYTGGIIGFTSRTHDMLELIRYYENIEPGSPLSHYLRALKTVDGSASKEGLGRHFEAAWKSAANDPKFRESQDHERDRVYFDPAVKQAIADGLQALGQFVYYDAIVMHGPGDDATSFGGIRAAAIRNAKLPIDGGDETKYLQSFLNARKAAMKAEQGHQDTTRVDTMEQKFLNERNLTLAPPLVFSVYGDAYRIDTKPPK